jgi:hypothetical protein
MIEKTFALKNEPIKFSIWKNYKGNTGENLARITQVARKNTVYDMEYWEQATTKLEVKRPSINIDVGQPSSNKIQCTTSLGDQRAFLRQNGRPKIYSPETISGFFPRSRLG